MADSADRRLEDLVREYGGLIRRVVARVAGRDNSRLVDDVEQEVLTALWKRLRGEQTIDRPASYVFKSARCEAIRALKREAARPTADPPAGWDAVPAERGDPLATLEAKELGNRIEAALARIGADRQRAVRAHLMGFDVDEIMRMTGWSYNKARNLIARGLADLRGLLKSEDRDG